MLKKSNLVWIDLEFSGLNPVNDVILEIATIVTDSNLSVIAEGPNLAIFQTDDILNNMDEWNTSHHGKSGLIEKCRNSHHTHESAEKKTLEFVQQYCDKKTSPLCGNSIHQDRRYLYKYMPLLSKFLHYRNIDVSSLQELVHRWASDIKIPRKNNTHRALDDIKESIEELKHYKNSLF